MRPLLISHLTATSCIGRGLGETAASLRAKRSGLGPCAFETVRLDTHVGEVPGVDEESLSAELSRFDCRNNRLAQLGLRQDGFMDAVRESAGRWGRRRIGLILGTSTSGMLATEIAYRGRDRATGALPADFDYAATQNSYSLAAFARLLLGFEGPATVISTACSSSAKAFGAAWRMIEAGWIDAAVVGGVDSLCLTTLYGFHSLQLVSCAPCRPFDAARDGISIGEAAAFALLERMPDNVDSGQILLTGSGESSDAYHMSSPHPQGRGAREAMEQALAAASLAPADIDYINLHGTDTPSNDAAEGCAVSDLFGPSVRASSTKGATGHALGAAGALEAVICAIALGERLMPGSVNTGQLDPAVGFDYLRENRRDERFRRALSNSFGFGGSNCSLVLERAA
ncbi:MAG TPA: beta-ketoacyl-[acyl-carrier-protein] synthase family protein [Steroidobacteraceae bacterium]|nr:beta-ketoacyl-[acyl-carrier-protein] synthase family protein [Steroidobacteraceae bacterium]